MEAGGSGNNQWEWEENGNKTRLNLGPGMWMNHWEWEGVGLKKTFPLISTSDEHDFTSSGSSPTNMLTKLHIQCVAEWLTLKFVLRSSGLEQRQIAHQVLDGDASTADVLSAVVDRCCCCWRRCLLMMMLYQLVILERRPPQEWRRRLPQFTRPSNVYNHAPTSSSSSPSSSSSSSSSF